ncbi:protein Abitram-like [Triticum urartu]|uniref:Protein Abitram n=2 Tax=Triticum urartu TaxID=4572 RepID=A0A8R7USL9_TRIUA|nr:protein Abitram-like [Triticum urartu]
MAGEDAAACAPQVGGHAPRDAASFDEETRALIAPDAGSLPATPPSAVEANFARYFAADYLNPGHDQYVYRHPNGLCVVGLAPAHVALKEEGGITAIDFNVGKTDRSEIKVTGKRKRNAQHLQENSALCKVCTKDKTFVVRCCVKGQLLEINDRLMKQPDLLNTSADREGYIAIFMQKPADWLKVKDKFLSFEEYKNLRGIC